MTCLPAYFSFKTFLVGAWVAQLVEHLPLAQVMIPGSWDPCSARSLLLLLSLPFTLTHVCVLSLSNKLIKYF